jgi:hypothetical protein
MSEGAAVACGRRICGIEIRRCIGERWARSGDASTRPMTEMRPPERRGAVVKRIAVLGGFALAVAGCSVPQTGRVSGECGVWRNDPDRPSRSGWVLTRCPQGRRDSAFRDDPSVTTAGVVWPGPIATEET